MLIITSEIVKQIYDYDLNDGSDNVQSANGQKNTIHNGNERIQIVKMDKYNNSPEEGWTITADWNSPKH